MASVEESIGYHWRPSHEIGGGYDSLTRVGFLQRCGFELAIAEPLNFRCRHHQQLPDYAMCNLLIQNLTARGNGEWGMGKDILIRSPPLPTLHEVKVYFINDH